MGQTENKGRGVRLLTRSGKAVTGYRLGRVPKRNSALCSEEVLINVLPQGLFRKATGYVSLFFLCVCGFVKAITYIHYQESAIQEFKKTKK